MAEVKCMDCGEEEKSWEEAERRGWRSWSDEERVCGRCKIVRSNQGRRPKRLPTFIKQGRRW